MEEKVTIYELIDRCIAYFRDNCYTEQRISRYRSLWRACILRFMSDKGIKYYSPSVGEEFVTTCHFNGNVRHHEREKIRSVQVVDDMLTIGRIRLRCLKPVHHALLGEIGGEMEKLITHLTNLRRSETTLKDYRLYLSEFLAHLTAHNVRCVREITEWHILVFVSSHPTNKVNIVSALRVLFRFWMQKGVVDGHFDELFDTYKVRHPERIPSFYAKEEIRRVEESLSRSSNVGKRDYAMVLLASRLGLRASDIANLQFANLDWDNNVISLRMQKTQKSIELPLIADVGNAIIDYLRHGRPKSESQHIFLSCRAPFRAATNHTVCSAINRAILKSGIDTGGKHHGPHALRHSLATAMLDAGTQIPIVSETLGHRSTQTTLTYLKIDISSLLKCALPVTPVSDGFYMQRGGAFYG